MLRTYINGGNRIEISDSDPAGDEVNAIIAGGVCKITNHPEGWDEFSLELADGRTVEGSYEWDDSGFLSLRVVEDGQRLRMYGVETQDALEEKLRSDLSEQDEELIAAIQDFNNHADSEEALFDFVAELLGVKSYTRVDQINDHCSIIEALVKAGWSVPNALDVVCKVSKFDTYICALYSEDEGECV